MALLRTEYVKLISDFFGYVTRVVNWRGAVDMAYLDFSKTFDTVLHKEFTDSCTR